MAPPKAPPHDVHVCPSSLELLGARSFAISYHRHLIARRRFANILYIYISMAPLRNLSVNRFFWPSVCILFHTFESDTHSVCAPKDTIYIYRHACLPHFAPLCPLFAPSLHLFSPALRSQFYREIDKDGVEYFFFYFSTRSVKWIYTHRITSTLCCRSRCAAV